MGNHHSTHRNVSRYAAQHVAQINEGLDSLAQALRQLIRERDSSIVPANISIAPLILLICSAIKIIRQRLVFGMGRQDVDPSFLLAIVGIAVALGCVECGLLMCVLLSGLPWLISVACALMLVVPFVFI